MNRILLGCMVALLSATAPATAADRPSADATSIAAAAVAAVAVAVDAEPQAIRVTAAVVPAQLDVVAKRPGILIGMYAACGLLQTYDGYSTIKANASNHAELNPLMAPFVKHPGLVIAAKAAMTVATIAAAENLWRTHHRGQAIAMLVVSNGLMAAVGAHNAMVLRGQR